MGTPARLPGPCGWYPPSVFGPLPTRERVLLPRLVIEWQVALVMYHGFADPLITPYGTIAYYESVVS